MSSVESNAVVVILPVPSLRYAVLVSSDLVRQVSS